MWAQTRCQHMCMCVCVSVCCVHLSVKRHINSSETMMWARQNREWEKKTIKIIQIINEKKRLEFHEQFPFSKSKSDCIFLRNFRLYFFFVWSVWCFHSCKVPSLFFLPSSIKSASRMLWLRLFLRRPTEKKTMENNKFEIECVRKRAIDETK